MKFREIYRQLLSNYSAQGRHLRLYRNGTTTRDNLNMNTNHEMKEQKYFEAVEDMYHGVTVNSNKDVVFNELGAILKASLAKWEKEGVRGVWFNVNLGEANWIPLLAKNGFEFHRAEGSVAVMLKWLPRDESRNIPNFAHTMMGVGAMVVREDTDEILVVREKYREKLHWKLPGGYIEKGENISTAATREVEEETGVKVEPIGLVATRHIHGMAYQCSDVYWVMLMRPITTNITICERELSDARWMPISEYKDHPLVNSTNQLYARTYLKHRNSGIAIRKLVQADLTGKLRDQVIYSLVDLDEDNLKNGKKVSGNNS